ncbi:ATP-dependent DNA ligase LigD polymerase module / ATP-dependent DNA ligase LigD phosphoesterase module (plasmid) [Burkholderia vietnamiensis G4]|uniref:DNA ligase (ATP) n=1 Tax=Burkholderia vietnamiensis (strain G4 / LMG 22486) TaxID=269482 RepID=A4JU25_BURVG|nr:ATP-dependent DNA ligase LigD polymerase module / ATP-dependent DNA ligase LigD phosphoesterase module [Burkholderia vietnamiensis G4]
MPAVVAPQLAVLARRPPSTGDWCWEIKFDGFRLMCRLEDGRARLFTRGGHDWASKMPVLARAIETLPVETVWLDGEVVVLNDSGLPDFNALQNAFDRRSTSELTYFAFDILFLNGRDLRALSLRERREALVPLIEDVQSDRIRISDSFTDDPNSLLASACRMRLEGIMGKRLDSPYRSGRSTDWIKLKCFQKQEFVVGGVTRNAGARSGIRSLMIGVHEPDGSLRYAGTVKAELRPTQRAELEQRAAALTTMSPPFYNPPARERGRDFVWLTPEIVVEVSFLEWTPRGATRQPTLKGLRYDKAASSVTEETVVDVDEPGDRAREGLSEHGRNARAPVVAGVKISNPNRVIDKQSGIRKIELVRYYDEISEFAIPYLTARPVSLVRAPDGVQGELFFQKHEERSVIPGITRLPSDFFPGHQPLLVIDTREALVGVAQMNAVEMHTWNASQPDLDYPDRFVLDLDPDPTLPWQMMTDAATLAKVLLDEIGLKSFIKTSGGKGYHIVVPVTRRQGWEEIKTFSQAIARYMARLMPERFSAVLGPKNRVGKIFIDYLRNSKGASTAAIFSARARPGMGVSMPIAWEELNEVASADQWNITNAAQRMHSLRVDPWAGYHRTRQGVTTSMSRAVGLK